MKKILLVLILGVVTASCNRYEELVGQARDNKEKKGVQFFDGEKEPEFPEAKENNQTILGVDNNKNGIRDDIDVWINYTAKDKNQRMALRQLATKLQKIMNYDERVAKVVKEGVASEVWEAMICLSFFERGKKAEELLFPKLSDVIFNSEKRIDAYKRFHYRGLVYGSNRDDARGEKEYLLCDFKIENLQDILKRNREPGY